MVADFHLLGINIAFVHSSYWSGFLAQKMCEFKTVEFSPYEILMKLCATCPRAPYRARAKDTDEQV